MTLAGGQGKLENENNEPGRQFNISNIYTSTEQRIGKTPRMGIFCRPSCQSKLPKRENVCYFASAEQARGAGFRPCKRCRSDLLEYQPMRDIAWKVKQKLDAADSWKEVGLTPRRLTDIFKQVYGMTPKEYTDARRLRAAEELLKGTEEKVIDIAYGTGFSSLSSFNRFFKKWTGKTPTEYRNSKGEKKG